MINQNRVVADLQSLPENVGLARLIVATVAAQAGFTLPDVEGIKLAVSEAVTNAIVHGYNSQAHQNVRLEVVLNGSMLEVVVEDKGRGIPDLDLARQPAVSSDPERMGLGFCFMESYMDELIVNTAVGQGTRVTMRKRADTSQPARLAAN